MEVSALGAIIGLSLAIFLIIKKVHPVYGLILGAVVGGLVGGAGVGGTVSLMIQGAQGIMPAVLRIITAGVLAGVLIGSGAAEKIAETIVDKIGETNSIIALILATFVLTAVGVFIDVAVITVAPTLVDVRAINLMAMIGGGKSGISYLQTLIQWRRQIHLVPHNYYGSWYNSCNIWIDCYILNSQNFGEKGSQD